MYILPEFLKYFLNTVDTHYAIPCRRVKNTELTSYSHMILNTRLNQNEEHKYVPNSTPYFSKTHTSLKTHYQHISWKYIAERELGAEVGELGGNNDKNKRDLHGPTMNNSEVL